MSENKFRLELLEFLLDETEPNDIYNYLIDIDSEDIVKFVGIVIFFIVLFRKHSITLAGIVGLTIGLFVIYVMNEKRRAKELSKKKTLKKKLAQIRPQPVYSHQYPDFIEFFHSIKELNNYNPYAFKKLIRNVDAFMRIHDDVLEGVQNCKNNYQVAVDLKSNALNHLHSIIFTIEDSPVIIEKLKYAINKLHMLLNLYLSNIIDQCKSDAKKKGLQTDTAMIEDKDVFPFNKFFDIPNREKNLHTYKMY